MSKASQKREKRIVRKRRIRSKISGTATRPRLAIFRSNAHLYAQLIDDTTGKTLVSVGDYKGGSKGSKIEIAQKLGKDMASSADAKGIKEAVFDRGGYIYSGRVKAFADAAREGGLKF